MLHFFPLRLEHGATILKCPKVMNWAKKRKNTEGFASCLFIVFCLVVFFSLLDF